MNIIASLLQILGGNCMAAETKGWEFKASGDSEIRVGTEVGGVVFPAAGRAVEAELTGE